MKLLTFIIDRESDGIVVSYVMGILEELADEVSKKYLVRQIRIMVVIMSWSSMFSCSALYPVQAEPQQMWDCEAFTEMLVAYLPQSEGIPVSG